MGNRFFIEVPFSAAAFVIALLTRSFRPASFGGYPMSHCRIHEFGQFVRLDGAVTWVLPRRGPRPRRVIVWSLAARRTLARMGAKARREPNHAVRALELDEVSAWCDVCEDETPHYFVDVRFEPTVVACMFHPDAMREILMIEAAKVRRSRANRRRSA